MPELDDEPTVGAPTCTWHAQAFRGLVKPLSSKGCLYLMPTTLAQRAVTPLFCYIVSQPSLEGQSCPVQAQIWFKSSTLQPQQHTCRSTPQQECLQCSCSSRQHAQRHRRPTLARKSLRLGNSRAFTRLHSCRSSLRCRTAAVQLPRAQVSLQTPALAPI